MSYIARLLLENKFKEKSMNNYKLVKKLPFNTTIELDKLEKELFDLMLNNPLTKFLETYQVFLGMRISYEKIIRKGQPIA